MTRLTKRILGGARALALILALSNSISAKAWTSSDPTWTITPYSVSNQPTILINKISEDDFKMINQKITYDQEAEYWGMPYIWTCPETATYAIECWGSKGQDAHGDSCVQLQGTYGSYGSYTYCEVDLEQGQQLLVITGLGNYPKAYGGNCHDDPMQQGKDGRDTQVYLYNYKQRYQDFYEWVHYDDDEGWNVSARDTLFNYNSSANKYYWKDNYNVFELVTYYRKAYDRDRSIDVYDKTILVNGTFSGYNADGSYYNCYSNRNTLLIRANGGNGAFSACYSDGSDNEHSGAASESDATSYFNTTYCKNTVIRQGAYANQEKVWLNAGTIISGGYWDTNDYEGLWTNGEKEVNGKVKITKIGYRVTYNSNKPSEATSNVQGTMKSSRGQSNSNITLRANTYTLKDWDFYGWATTANGDVAYADKATYKVTSNATLYAVWKPSKYTITFNSNKPSSATGSITGSVTKIEVKRGEEATLPSNTYKLTGWKAGSTWTTSPNGGTSYSAGTKFKPTSDITLYATWTPITYKIQYNKGATNN
jgi:hypothetical protein